MVVLQRGSWVGRRLRIRLRKLGRFGTPVLVVAAALFGAAVSATIIVGFWDKEARDRKLAEARLTDRAQHAKALAGANARLRRQPDGSRATSARLEQGAARRRVAAQAHLRQHAELVATAD